MRRVSMLVAGEETRRGGWKEVDEDDRGKWRALACAGVVVVDELVVVVVVWWWWWAALLVVVLGCSAEDDEA